MPLKRTTRNFLALTLLLAIVMLSGLIPSTSSPASADDGPYQSPCNTNYGKWTSANVNGYTYKPGGWCIFQYYYWHPNVELDWQTDGNLVLYSDGSFNPGDTHVPVWSSHTAGHGALLNFQSNGNLRILDAHGAMIWQTGTGGSFKNYTYWLQIKDYNYLALTQGPGTTQTRKWWIYF